MKFEKFEVLLWVLNYECCMKNNEVEINSRLTIPPSSTSRSSVTIRIMLLALAHSAHLNRQMNRVRENSKPEAHLLTLMWTVGRFLWVFLDSELAMSLPG